MESKKLQQLQQANSHLAPQPMPQKRAPSFHPSTGDYRPAHSPVFQNHTQYQSVSSNFSGQHHQGTPQDHIHTKHLQASYQQQHQVATNPYHAEQLYQSGRERLYHQTPTRPSHYPPVAHSHPHPVASLQQQYQQLQQAKIQQQIQTQNEALAQQQRTFALRQQLNPPIPQSHYHLGSQSLVSTPVQPQLQQPALQITSGHATQRNVPPSTLNLTSQFQPAPGPVKLNNLEIRSQHFHQDLHNQHLIQTQKIQSQAIYQQNQQIQQQILHGKVQTMTPGDNAPVYIQQNHPGHVVNQACQTQISGAIGNKTKTPTTEEPKSPAPHQPLDRKKSVGTIQLKSPITKRPASSPVTISGWLYKQGSDGLKVWRKRWFVLSEYCLYYYKGPEEEKLLGSILLPSYKVGACSPEDKIYRKYAFKCEHTNMRTYWLAAENAETMGQWVRALTAATMMQGSSESDQASQPSVSSLNHSGENSDSGIHTFQSQQSKLSIPQGPVTPASDSGGGPQPLYANAPPKPRRANDGGYSSPSPENSVERCETNTDPRHNTTSGHYGRRNDMKPSTSHQQHHHVQPQQQQQQQPHQQQQLSQHKPHQQPQQQQSQHHVIYDTRTGNITSSLKMERMQNNSTTEAMAAQLKQMQLEHQISSPNTSQRDQPKSPFQISEYGKSLPIQPTIIPPDHHDPNEFDHHIIKAPQRFNDDPRMEMYGEKEIYMQRMIQQKYPSQIHPGPSISYTNAERRTPDTYGRSKSDQTRKFSDYEDIYQLNQQNQLQQQAQIDMGSYRRPLSPPSYDNSKHVPPMPSRYTPTHLESATSQVNLRARPTQPSNVPRPHSADFLEYEARAEAAAKMKPEPIRAPRPKSSLDINRNPDNLYYSEASYAEKMRQSALYLQKPQNPQQQQQQQQPQQQQQLPPPEQQSQSQIISSGYQPRDLSPYAGSNTIAHESPYDRSKRIEMMNENINQGALSIPRIHRGSSKGYSAQQNEQFLRSASARLPRKDDESTLKDGERKREESMKRLLEWKQRMLQSPLTRKGTQQSNSSTSKLASSQILLSPHGIQRSRSETNANAGYNSYSSDDEDGPEFSPAGRSSPTPSSSIVVDTTNTNNVNSPPKRKIPQNNKKQIAKKLSTSLLENPTYVPVYAQKTLQDKVLTNNPSSTESPLVTDTSTAAIKILDSDQLLELPTKEQVQLDDAFVEIIEIKEELGDTSDCKLKNEEDDLEIIEIKYDEPLPPPPAPDDDIMRKQSDIESDEDDDKTFEYTDDDLDEALAEEDENLVDRKLYENDPITPTNQMSSAENHYLPMNPKRSVLSPTGSLALTNTSMDEIEENPYVEMTKGLKQEESSKVSNYEIVCIGASFKSDSEPVYMELSHAKLPADESSNLEDVINNGKSTIKKSTLKKLDKTNKKKPKKSSERLAKRKDLPDILKASQNTTILNSDSSDADDESPMKDINNIKLRSRSRFSLSDTFRPASYYLGSSTPLANCAESSDSEIVSPPPIPSSPPPMEELNTEEIFSSENYDTVKRRGDKLNLSFDQIPKIHSSNSSLSLNNKTEGHKSSRLSLPDQFSKLRNFKPPTLQNNERTLSDSNYSFNTDNSSNTSSDYDLYNKLKNSSPSFAGTMYQSNSSLPQKFGTTDSSETESVELRHRQGSDSELERQRSRRPLSEESISEIESMSEHFEETLATTDLDSYLNRLQTSDLYFYQNIESGWIGDGITGLIKPPEVFRNEDDEHFYGNINFVSSTDSIQKIGNEGPSESAEIPTENIHPAKLNVLSPLKEKNLSIHDAQCESEDLKTVVADTSLSVDLAKSATLSSIDMDQTSFCTAYDLTHMSPVHSRNNSNISDQSAPYYYSDINSRNASATDITETLNNQRDINLKRTGISHIHNPISKKNEFYKTIGGLSESTRSLSAEILNVSDKDKSINLKNLYKMKPSLEKNISKNLRYRNLKQQQQVHDNSEVLEADCTTSSIVLTPSVAKITNYSPTTSSKVSNVDTVDNINVSNSNISNKLSDLTAGEQLWEEDALWRESLRRVSQRHARSLDDLDRITENSPPTSSSSAKSNRVLKADKAWNIKTPSPKISSSSGTSIDSKQKQAKLTREVTYVNDNISPQLRSSYRVRQSEPIPSVRTTSLANWSPDNNDDEDIKNDENDVYVQLAVDENSDVYETLRLEKDTPGYSRKSVEIDREVIRQWDSMSSGLMKRTGGTTSTTSRIVKNKQMPQQQQQQQKTSISVRNVRNIPKVNLTVKPEPSDPIDIHQSNMNNSYYTSMPNTDHNKYITTPDRSYYSSEADAQSNYDKNSYTHRRSYHPLRKSGSRAEIDLLERETSSQIRNLDMSAGDLLSRTHEELVLLLIQLRRQNSTTARAIEQCCTDIHEVQNRIRISDGPTRAEHISRLDYLKQHLLELEKQYEKSKPLVNLVDNMVKLGSLYRNNETNRHIYQPESVTLDRLEFNQKVQERRLLQEEQKHWDRLSPNHTELQSKVRQLYQLDQLLQEESGTLQSLQRDKEDLERALGGLRARLQDTNDPPVVLEAAKKQQHALERELSRVHQLLAENSKKLEQTVAGNARLEQELLVLRQKLQASRGSRGSQGALAGIGSQVAGDNGQYPSSTTALLESELRRVQQLVGDMQRQRQELSQAVKQLTENSNTLYQQIGTKDQHLSSHIKKRHPTSCWTETDLDSMQSTDHTLDMSSESNNLSTPLYVDTNSANSSSTLMNCSTSSKFSDYDPKTMRNYRYSESDGIESSGIDSDDLLESSAFANLTNQEKQEIKTVRIVKRESERRHRDRERSGVSNQNTVSSSQNLDQVLEEENHNQISSDDYNYMRSKSLPRSYNETYEAIKQVKDHRKQHEPPKTLPLINSNITAYASNPAIPINYTDYFTNSNKNPYPVSMTDINYQFSPNNSYPINNKISYTGYLETPHQKTAIGNYDSMMGLKNKTESVQSLTKAIGDLSPVFQSEAARQIIIEMSGSASEDNNEKVPLAHKHRRAIPKEKRRHYTAPNNVNVKAMQNVQSENDMNRNNTNWRARDDLDMEVALRPRINAPDVVRSALGPREKISENTIDKLLAAPSKILIPERYIPEQTPELSPEEKKRRQEKVEAIKKMLSEAPINSSNDTVSLPPSKINAEKKQREHLLQLNQILAQQVMQMSKIVAEKAMAALPSKIAELNTTTSEEDHSSSPTSSLPIYQQRENFFT